MSEHDSVTLSSSSSSSDDQAPVVPRPKSAAMTAALHAADAAAALTDTPVAPVASGSSTGTGPAGAVGGVGGGGKDPQLDRQSVLLPHLPSPFDAVYPATRGGDRWTNLAPDGHCMLCALEPGTGPNAPVLNRVYVNVVGMLPDGTTFLDFPHEELDFTLGQGQRYTRESESIDNTAVHQQIGGGME